MNILLSVLIVLSIVALPFGFIFWFFKRKCDRIVEHFKNDFVQEITPIIKDFNFIADRNLSLLEEKIFLLNELFEKSNISSDLLEESSKEFEDSVFVDAKNDEPSMPNPAYILDIGNNKKKSLLSEAIDGDPKDSQIQNISTKNKSFGEEIEALEDDVKNKILLLYDNNFSINLISKSVGISEDLIKFMLFSL